MKNEELFEFKVGDKVKCAFFGDEIFTVELSEINNAYPLCIRPRDITRLVFTKNGLYSASHTHPILTLVERPKKQKEVTIETFGNIYNDETICLHKTERTASYNSKDNLGRITDGILNKTNKKIKITYYEDVE